MLSLPKTQRLELIDKRPDLYSTVGRIEFSTFHGKEVAIKTIPHSSSAVRECLLIKNFKHRNIAKCYQVFVFNEIETIAETVQSATVISIVMEKHDKHIGDLNVKERSFLKELLLDILGEFISLRKE